MSAADIETDALLAAQMIFEEREDDDFPRATNGSFVSLPTHDFPFPGQAAEILALARERAAPDCCQRLGRTAGCLGFDEGGSIEQVGIATAVAGARRLAACFLPRSTIRPQTIAVARQWSRCLREKKRVVSGAYKRHRQKTLGITPGRELCEREARNLPEN